MIWGHPGKKDALSEDFQRSQDRHGNENSRGSSVVWPRDAGAARMPGEQNGSVGCAKSETCFMISGLTLDLVVTKDLIQMNSPSFARGNSAQDFPEVFGSVLKETVYPP